MEIEPKLLTPERIIDLYKVYVMTGCIFEGSPMLQLFQHIAALTNEIKKRDQALVEIIDKTGNE